MSALGQEGQARADECENGGQASAERKGIAAERAAASAERKAVPAEVQSVGFDPLKLASAAGAWITAGVGRCASLGCMWRPCGAHRAA